VSERWRRLSAVVLGLCLWRPAAPAAPGSEDVKVELRREAVQRMLASATPYNIEVGGSLLKETLTFSDPRDLGFGDGRITFAVRCQGNPFPVDQILHPIFTLRRGNGGYRLVAESVLVSVPGFGRVDLKDFFAPVDIQSLLTQGLNLSGRPTMLEVKVEKIVLSRDIIDIAARLQLTPLTNR